MIDTDGEILRAVHARLDQRLQHHTDHPIMLALSGGGDSIALMSVARDWARLRGRRLIAVTIDHGLSPASRDWSRFCRQAAQAQGLDWREALWTGDKPVTGLSAAARQARHTLLAQAAREAGAKTILMAHTRDDIAEADLMRNDGSTLGSLREWSPSPVWPEGEGLILFRPLLDQSRQTLRDYLVTQGADWIEDPANSDDRYARSRARKRLSALARPQPATPAPFSSTPSPTKTPPLLNRPRPLPLGAGFMIDRNIDTDTLFRVLVCASGRRSLPRRDRVQALCTRLQSGDTFVATLAGARLIASTENVTIGREAGDGQRRSAQPSDRETPAHTPVPIRAGYQLIWDGRYRLYVTNEGLSVRAAAGVISQLSQADITILKPIPAALRATLPVLIRDGQTDPVLAWRVADCVALAPRRLALALDETTQEVDLFDETHGEMAPTDLF